MPFPLGMVTEQSLPDWSQFLRSYKTLELFRDLSLSFPCISATELHLSWQVLLQPLCPQGGCVVDKAYGFQSWSASSHRHLLDRLLRQFVPEFACLS